VPLPTAAPGPAAVTPTQAATPRPVDTKLVKTKLDKRKRTATFTFRSVGGSAPFECAVAKKGKKATFKPCRSPVTYKKLTGGSYGCEVRARGDAAPAGKAFKV